MDGDSDECDSYYHNAVKILEDSDEDTTPNVTPVKEEKKLGDPVLKLPQKRGSGRQTQQVEDVVLTHTESRRKRTRGQNTGPQNYNSNGVGSAHSSGGDAMQMLTIVEINDSPSPLPRRGRSRGYVNDIPHAVSSTEPLRQFSDSSDIISVDGSFSYVETDVVDVAIHVKWRGKAIEAFHLNKSSKLKSIFEHFAKLEGVSENQVVLTHNGKSLYALDTPEKFKSGVIILDGSLKKLEEHELSVDPNQIELNVLRKDKKGKLSIYIARTDTMKVFMDKTATELSVPLDRLQFLFDGDKLNSDDTPDSLDLEGGECVEVIVRP